MGSIGTKAHKKCCNSSHGRSQGVQKIFRAPMYRAHCAVIFAIAQLSCSLFSRALLSIKLQYVNGRFSWACSWFTNVLSAVKWLWQLSIKRTALSTAQPYRLRLSLLANFSLEICCTDRRVTVTHLLWVTVTLSVVLAAMPLALRVHCARDNTVCIQHVYIWGIHSILTARSAVFGSFSWNLGQNMDRMIGIWRIMN